MWERFLKKYLERNLVGQPSIEIKDGNKNSVLKRTFLIFNWNWTRIELELTRI